MLAGQILTPYRRNEDVRRAPDSVDPQITQMIHV
jgi:hypothetical protein